jgi:hypothetical protein
VVLSLSPDGVIRMKMIMIETKNTQNLRASSVKSLTGLMGGADPKIE